MRGFILLTARILVSAALLYVAFRGIDFAGIQTRLRQIDLSWAALAVLATLFQVFIGALRWAEISTKSGAPLRVGQAFRYNLIGTFFNQTLPSTIGGDAMRLWLVARTGAGWRIGTYSVLVDRAIGLIALAVIVVASLPWSYELVANTRGRLALLLVDLGALAAGLGFLLYGRLSWRWLQALWPLRHIHACAVIANNVIFSRASGFSIAALSLLVHVMTVVIVWCTVQAIAAPAAFSQLFLLVPPVMLITMLPISIAGWGLREATMMVAFGYAGLSPADGTVVSLLFGAASFIVGTFGGLAWISSNEKAMARDTTIEKDFDDDDTSLRRP